MPKIRERMSQYISQAKAVLKIASRLKVGVS